MYFKKYTFFVIIDSLTSCLRTRKEAYTNHNKIYGCIPCLFKQPNKNLISERCINLASCFSSDIESEHLLNDECNHFKIMISIEDSINSSYKMLSFIKRKDYYDIFPNLTVVLRMYLSTALTNCSGERPFSALKRIKNCLRSTTTSTRLNALSLLNIEN